MRKEPEPDARHDVRHECVAAVVLPDRAQEEARVELVGGRPRYSVGGQIHEGVRWWRGQIDWVDSEIDLRPGTEIRIVMDDGRSALAVVVEESPDRRTASLRGVGPPPFDVP